MTEELTPKTINDYIVSIGESAKKIGYHMKVSEEMFKETSAITKTLSQALYGSSTGSGSSMVRRHRTKFDNRETCPDCGEIASLNNIIMHLNDVAHWSREEIADWLDTLDNQPVFYPDTCPEDCECELCKPEPRAHVTIASGATTVGYLTEGEYTLTTNNINEAALKFFYGNDYQPQPYQITYEVDTEDISTEEHLTQKIGQCTGTFTVSQELFYQLSNTEIDAIYNITKDTGCPSVVKKELDTNAYTFTFTGNQVSVKQSMQVMQQIIKGTKKNVQPHPHYCSHCNSAGTKLCAGCPAAKPAQH